MSETRTHYLLFNLSNEQLDLLTEGLHMLRLYQQGFVDVDGRGKLTAIKHLEARIQRRREQYRQKSVKEGAKVNE